MPSDSVADDQVGTHMSRITSLAVLTRSQKKADRADLELPIDWRETVQSHG